MADHSAQEARIKAEALREAADLLVAECSSVSAPCFCSAAPWLRDRADALHPPVSQREDDPR